jgi:hypothetical protein
MFNLAELFVTISAKDDALQKSLGGVRQSLSLVGAFAKGLNPFAGWEREVDKTKKSVGALDVAIGNLAASAIGRATSALSGFFSRGIAGAADLGESISKVDAVFGASSGKIKGMADDMARSFGLPKLALIDGATAIGMIGKAAGQSQDAAAGLGVKLAKAAADASSFYDVPLDVALEKIRSGLVGQSEPLLAFGVLLNEEAVAAEAVAMGLAKSAREVDQQAKVMARASLITKGLGDATGDLARTIDSPKNQWRKFAGTLENTSDAIGTSLMPAISAVTTALGDMASRVASSVEANKDSIKDWADSIAGAIRAVPDAWDSFVAGLAVAFLKVEEWSTNVMAVFAVIPENLSRIGSWIGNNWTKMIAPSSRIPPRASNSTGRPCSTASRRRRTSSPSCSGRTWCRWTAPSPPWARTSPARSATGPRRRRPPRRPRRRRGRRRGSRPRGRPGTSRARHPR